MDELKVMPDVDTTGIYDKFLEPIPFDKIDISEELKEKFRKWVKFYENDCHKTRHFIFRDEMAETLNERGLTLALELKRCFPNARVSYIGEDDLGYILEKVVHIPK